MCASYIRGMKPPGQASPTSDLYALVARFLLPRWSRSCHTGVRTLEHVNDMKGLVERSELSVERLAPTVLDHG